MDIQLTHLGVKHRPVMNELALHGIRAFAYLLNTFAHRGVWFSFKEFAALIRANCSDERAIAVAIALEAEGTF